MTELTFFSHGACQEVTGSKHFLRSPEWLIEFDCGMFQGKRAETYARNQHFPFNPQSVNAVILSHAHYDHSGALPLLKKKGFNGPIYSTPATRDLTAIILQDSAHIQEKDYLFIQKSKERFENSELEIFPPLYNQQNVLEVMENFITVGYHRRLSIFPDLELEFFDAGHILGSALAIVESKNLRVAFSGDLGRKDLPLIRDPEILPEVDYLILEGTYGNRLHKPFTLVADELRQLMQKAIERASKIIIPAFSVERTQELIYVIHKLFMNSDVEAIPIYVDSPMAINATEIFRLHQECFDQETQSLFFNNGDDPFGFDGIHYVQSVEESKKLNGIKGPAIIISASGMAESGRILHHLASSVENEKNIIAIVGFMAEHTLGRKIVERRPNIKIFGRSYRLRAEVATLNYFSAHADYKETVEWLKTSNLSRLRKIFLVHGERDALANLKKEIEDTLHLDVEIVDEKKEYQLL